MAQGSQLQNLHLLTASEAVALFKSNEITVTQYAQALLARIEERDSTVKAWTYLDKQYILDQARALDQVPAEKRGPLHGVGVAIKDIMDTEDMPTEYGSKLYNGNRPGMDSSPVSILRTAGALILGKATTTEFTLLNRGPETTNPHDKTRTPGGSSAGPAAAVADYQATISFGTQNGGSIIRPASYTGIFAMKPTMQAIAGDGVKLLSISVDTVGFFARSMEDLQLIGHVFRLWQHGDVEHDFTLKDVKVAMVKTPMWDAHAKSSTIAAMKKSEEILKAHGVSVTQEELPFDFADAKALKLAHKTILRIEGQAALLMEYRLNPDKLSQEVRNLVNNTDKLTHKQALQAMDMYAHLRSSFDRFVADYSVIITPSAEDVAPKGLMDMGSSGLNFLWTGLHAPCIHVPAFVGDHNMPVGVSIVGGRFKDVYTLKIASLLSNILMKDGGWNVNQLGASTQDSQALPGATARF